MHCEIWSEEDFFGEFYADNFLWLSKQHIYSCPTLCNPMDYSRQAPLFMGFSGQEYWSGLPFLLQGIFPTQGSNLGLLHCRQILYQLSLWGHLFKLHPNIMIPWSLLCVALKLLSVKWTSFIFWYVPAAELLGWEGEGPHKERCPGAEKRGGVGWRWSGGTVLGAVCVFRTSLHIPRSQHISEGC